MKLVNEEWKEYLDDINLTLGESSYFEKDYKSAYKNFKIALKNNKNNLYTKYYFE
jgi:uncharacterized protein HemY